MGALYNLFDKEASLNTYLNNDWYNSLDSSVKTIINSNCAGVNSYHFTITPSCYRNSSNHNWVSGISQWTISLYSDLLLRHVFVAFSSGDIYYSDYGIEFHYDVVSVFFLSSDIILKGEGTSFISYTVS